MPRRVFLLALLAASCRPAMSDQAYADEFLAAAKRYLAAAKGMNAAFTPPPRSLDRKGKLEFLAQRLDADAAKMKAVADPFRKISPPSKFEKLHIGMVAFLDLNRKTFADDAARVRESIRTGGRAKLGDIDGAELTAALKEVQTEARRLGLEFPAPP